MKCLDPAQPRLWEGDDIKLPHEAADLLCPKCIPILTKRLLDKGHTEPLRIKPQWLCRLLPAPGMILEIKCTKCEGISRFSTDEG